MRQLIPIAVVSASLVAALVVSLLPSPESEAPPVANVVPVVRRTSETVARGASHDENAPGEPPAPTPGDPWPAARWEEDQHRRRHLPRPTPQPVSIRPNGALLAEAALRIASGEWGTRSNVWEEWTRQQSSWSGSNTLFDFQDITSLSPKSLFAASFEEYAAIRGGEYFSGQDPDLRGDAKYDPDREIPGYIAWIQKYPAHPGVDDACFRLGRCFGIRGNGRRALHWFRRAQEAPDGDMARDARVWELLWLDMLLPLDELRAEAAGGDPAAVWSLGVRLVRRGEIAEGRLWMRSAYPSIPDELRYRAKVHLDKVESLARVVTTGDLYEIGRVQYHTHGLYDNVLWPYGRNYDLYAEDVLWAWGHASAPAAFVAEYRLASRHWQARRTFLRVVDDRPGGELEVKARFSATTALGHTQGCNLEQRMVSCPEEDRVRLAREFLAIARDFPESNLADDALLFSGRFSGDPEVFREILTRYPNGDMAERAAHEFEQALRYPPLSLESLGQSVTILENGFSNTWKGWQSLRELERHLGFCTRCLERLRGAERKREVRKLTEWFRTVESRLEFDRTVGIYVVGGHSSGGRPSGQR